jgi:protein-tyrosine-phosphatase
MGGDRTLMSRPPQAKVPPHVQPSANGKSLKKRVLFFCIGNACRSQMAEAFARAYGSDILAAHSAGLSPAAGLPPLTRQVLTEKRIPSDGQFPKGLEAFGGESFEVVINLSGERLPPGVSAARLVEWNVRDPIGESETVYRAVAAQIEGLVMRLILELRAS